MSEFELNDFSKRLKLTAYEKFGNLKNLAEESGIENISIYTQKKAREPRAKVLYKLAKIGVDINYLLTGIKATEVFKEEDKKILKKQIQNLIDTVDKIAIKQ